MSLNFSMEADMRRARDRCPACAKLQLELENGQFVPGESVGGEIHDVPRSGGRRPRRTCSPSSSSKSSPPLPPPGSINNISRFRSQKASAASSVSLAGSACTAGSDAKRPHSPPPLLPRGNQQHQHRPLEILCNHCLCTSASHVEAGPDGRRCCGGERDPWERACEACRYSDACRVAARGKVCPAEAKENANEVKAGGEGDGGGAADGGGVGGGDGGGGGACKARWGCVHCKCACAADRPHMFDAKSSRVASNPASQTLCGLCLGCWSGWCYPAAGSKRKRVGATRQPEEPFARQWRPGRDDDVYVLTGLFDDLTGLLPEGSFPHAVFGSSLRYLKGFIAPLDARHALREAGVTAGDRAAAIGEAWSGGGSQHPPEKPAGARKVVAAPLRQGAGADRHFSRRHGRRDHNWQWDMLKSPWSLGLMRKGRLALGVSEEEADEFEEAGIIAFPGHVVKHRDSVKNGGYGKTIGTLVLRSPEAAFVCLQIQGELLGRAVDAAREMGVDLPPKFGQKGRFKFAINELDAWAMVGGAARNEAEHAVVCGRRVIPTDEPGQGFVRIAFNMRWGWQDDRRV